MSVFKALSGASNGILDRFCILVPNCRKLSEELENESLLRLAELDTGGVTVERIYELVADMDEDTVFTLSLMAKEYAFFQSSLFVSTFNTPV